MTTDSPDSQQTYQYFLQESAELLQTMDDELQTLRQNFSVQTVHNLMRAAHTLKGASASVGLDAIQKATHSLEDIFRALCYPDTAVSVEMEALIFRAYDCLKLLLSAQLAGAEVDETDILERMATVVAHLQKKLGSRFGQSGHLPTSSELGFDMTRSIFEVGVAQRIETLSKALENPDSQVLLDLLKTQCEVYAGLAESLDLRGFGEIAQTTLEALSQQPDKILEIALVALENFRLAQVAVLEGDRQQGGAPLPALEQFCTEQNASHPLPIPAKASRIRRLWKALTHPIGQTQQDSINIPEVLSTTTFTISPGADVDFFPLEGFTATTGDGREPLHSLLRDLALFDADSTTPNSTSSLVAIASSTSNNLETDRSQTDDLETNSFETDRLETNSRENRTAPVIAPPLAAAQSQQATIRMSVEHLDQLSHAMGELLTHQNRQALYNEQLVALVQKLLNRISRQQEQLNQLKAQSLMAEHPASQHSSRQHSAYQHPTAKSRA
ncbi:MAG: Hpt domain-containing protein, partial [Phormidesmis sp.]